MLVYFPGVATTTNSRGKSSQAPPTKGLFSFLGNAVIRTHTDNVLAQQQQQQQQHHQRFTIIFCYYYNAKKHRWKIKKNKVGIIYETFRPGLNHIFENFM